MSDLNTDPNDKPSNRQRLALLSGVTGLVALGIGLVARSRRRGPVSEIPLPSEETDSFIIPAPTSAKKSVSHVSAWLALIACGLMVLGAFGFRYVDHTFAPEDAGVLLVLAGGLLLGIAMWQGRSRLPWLVIWARPVTQPDSDVSLLKITIGTTLLALLAEINTGLLGIVALEQTSPHIQMALFVGGVILIVWGMTGGQLRFRPVTGAIHRLSSSRRRELFLLTAITLLALAVRTWNLEYALHIFMDEMHFVDGLTTIRDGSPVLMLRPMNYVTAFPWIFSYLQWGGVEIFGPSLVGIRLVSVFMGTLTIPALYLLARTLFDRKTALLAAFLLAVFPPHIHFSRLGMNNVADPLFGTLALAFLARGFKTGRRTDYVLAGAMLGLTQYFYEGGRLFYPALMGLWLIVIVFTGRRMNWRGLAALAFTAFLIAMPFYYTQIGLSYSLVPRLERMGHSTDYIEHLLDFDSSDGGLNTYLKNNIRPPLMHLIYTPDGTFSGDTGFFYGGNTALILPYMLPLFLLGLFYALWSRRTAGALPLLWVLLVILGNSLIREADWSARFVVVFPALPLLMAVGVRYVLSLILPVFAPVDQPVSGQRLVTGLTILAVIGLGLAQIPYYFGPHLEINNRQVRRYDLDFHDVMFRSRDLPAGTHVILITNDALWWPHITGMIVFWKLDITFETWSSDDLVGDHLGALDRRNAYAFFVKPTDDVTIRLLHEMFDDLQGPIMSPDRYNVPRDRQYWMYFAERRSFKFTGYPFVKAL
jgi:hypothetical protein